MHINWSSLLFWRCCAQLLEQLVLEVLCTVIGAACCSGGVVPSNWSSLLFCRWCAQHLEQLVNTSRTTICSNYCAQHPQNNNSLQVLCTTLPATYILYTEEFSKVLLHADNGNVNQLFYTIVCSLKRPETCWGWCGILL
jgi:hypothetical protein